VKDSLARTWLAGKPSATTGDFCSDSGGILLENREQETQEVAQGDLHDRARTTGGPKSAAIYLGVGAIACAMASWLLWYLGMVSFFCAGCATGFGLLAMWAGHKKLGFAGILIALPPLLLHTKNLVEDFR
jgi:hypothetical protein